MAVDCYLYLENSKGSQIEGEATDIAFQGYIEIFKFDFDAVSEVKAEDVLDLNLMPSPEPLSISTTANGETGSMPNAMGPLVKTVKKAQENQTGKDSFTFSISKYLDASTPLLLKTFCSASAGKEQGPAFLNAIVYVMVGGIKRDSSFTGNTSKLESLCALVFKFQNLQITSYQMSYEGGLLEEKLTFYFDQYIMEYQRQLVTGGTASSADAKVTKGYNFTTNKPAS